MGGLAKCPYFMNGKRFRKQRNDYEMFCLAINLLYEEIST